VINQEISTLNVEIKNTNTTLSSNINQLHNSINNKIEITVESINSKIHNITSTQTEILNMYDKFNAQINNVESIISKNDTKYSSIFTALDNKTTQTNLELQNNIRRIAGLEQKFVSFGNEISLLKDEIKKLCEGLSNLSKNDVSGIISKSLKIQSEFSALSSEIKNLQTTNDFTCSTNNVAVNSRSIQTLELENRVNASDEQIKRKAHFSKKRHNGAFNYFNGSKKEETKAKQEKEIFEDDGSCNI
jgi:hypothetical protein